MSSVLKVSGVRCQKCQIRRNLPMISEVTFARPLRQLARCQNEEGICSILNAYMTEPFENWAGYKCNKEMICQLWENSKIQLRFRAVPPPTPQEIAWSFSFTLVKTGIIAFTEQETVSPVVMIIWVSKLTNLCKAQNHFLFTQFLQLQLDASFYMTDIRQNILPTFCICTSSNIYSISSLVEFRSTHQTLNSKSQFST